MLNNASGFDHTIETYLKAGERIWNLIRLFNLREGFDLKNEWLPPRMFQDAFTTGPAKGKLIPEDEFHRSLQEYYLLRGWDVNGIPTPEKVTELGLMNYSM